MGRDKAAVGRALVRDAAAANACPTAVTNAARIAELVLSAGQSGTVVFTGAGVSTESGIPDFRSPGGIWSRYAPIQYAEYLRDPAMRRESWRRGLHTYATMVDAQPNAAHLAIADWWHARLISGVVTQNIDGLHHKAGLPEEAIVELHGNAHWIGCLSCAARFDRATIHARVLAGDEDPACLKCGGILKTTTISFGQGLPEAALARARYLHATARLCLVIGSSLVVYPAATLPEVTLEAGGDLVIVNQTHTHLDHLAVLVAREPAAVLLGQVRVANPR
jgi:NAD-dependent deacetylase